MNRIAVMGNTYPVREKLKALGAKWNNELKAWMVEADKAEEAQRIVAGAGPKKTYTGNSGRAGAWNGCSMGCREGNPNPRCKTCCFDEFDN